MKLINFFFIFLPIFLLTILAINAYSLNCQSEIIKQYNSDVLESAKNCIKWIENSYEIKRTHAHQYLYDYYLNDQGKIKQEFRITNRNEIESYLANTERLLSLRNVFKTGLTKSSWLDNYKYYKSIETNEIHFGTRLLGRLSGKLNFLINKKNHSESKTNVYRIKNSQYVEIEMQLINMKQFELDTLRINKRINTDFNKL